MTLGNTSFRIFGLLSLSGIYTMFTLTHQSILEDTHQVLLN